MLYFICFFLIRLNFKLNHYHLDVAINCTSFNHHYNYLFYLIAYFNLQAASYLFNLIFLLKRLLECWNSNQAVNLIFLIFLIHFLNFGYVIINYNNFISIIIQDFNHHLINLLLLVFNPDFFLVNFFYHFLHLNFHHFLD